ncbi:hypothetical protein KM043_017229 [Ampulex compressa]|nr:hypothetical protein KM043_017229 [Ampulex compressa]
MSRSVRSIGSAKFRSRCADAPVRNVEEERKKVRLKVLTMLKAHSPWLHAPVCTRERIRALSAVSVRESVCFGNRSPFLTCEWSQRVSPSRSRNPGLPQP